MSDDRGYVRVPEDKPIPEGAVRWKEMPDGRVRLRTAVYLFGFPIWTIERFLTRDKARGAHNWLLDALADNQEDIEKIRDGCNDLLAKRDE